MNFGQLLEYNVRNTFLQKSRRKWGRETSYMLFLFFKKASYKIKAVSNLVLIYFGRPLSGYPTKANLTTLGLTREI